MNTFKTIVVVGTLLGVGYGAHIVMNKPISNQPYAIADKVWDDLVSQKPEVDVDGSFGSDLVGDLPEVSVGEGGASPPAGFNPPPVPPSDMPAVEMPTTGTPAPDATNTTTPGPLMPVPPQQSSAQADGEATSVYADELSAVQPVGSQIPAGPTAELASATSVPFADAMEASPATNWDNGFEEMWSSVQLKLQSSQFVDALLTLSLFYNDEGLTGEQRDRMTTLLDQLAGTVIYSPDYHMEPVYVVQPGETLQSIAAAYSVPETLLARINGIASGELAPGQQLKVLRGPFRGQLTVDKRELTLFLGRYYAGRFSIGIGRDLPAQISSLEVAEMGAARPFVDRRTGEQIAAGAPQNPYGNYWIGLREPGGQADPFMGIHATGDAVDASDTRGCISVSDRDANDLQAILSIGSPIIVMP